MLSKYPGTNFHLRDDSITSRGSWNDGGGIAERVRHACELEEAILTRERGLLSIPSVYFNLEIVRIRADRRKDCSITEGLSTLDIHS